VCGSLLQPRISIFGRGAGSSGRRSACTATADTKIDKLKFLAADSGSIFDAYLHQIAE